jgi:peptide/nickel transport system permease protein
VDETGAVVTEAEFEGQPMSWDKVKSILIHLIVPTFVIGTSGAAAMMQRLRANMLDELSKPYVETAVAKGLSQRRTLTKYPLRVALNPFVADIGNLLPSLISGSVLVSVVLGLQTIGPALLTALKSQDQFLAGFILMFVALLTLIGTMVSDVLLMLLDPRIKYGGRGK